MVKKEESMIAKFEGRALSSMEQHQIKGGTLLDLTGKNGTPITSSTKTKPSKVPVSTSTNGDPRPTDPLTDPGLFTQP
ncbi:MAG: hypothetical protein AB8B56_02415 [Crocinitomicaceae bacterium]